MSSPEWDIPALVRVMQVGKAQPAVHRSILIIDVEHFGAESRTNADQLAIRAGMYKVLRQSLAKARVGRAAYVTEDRGDGVLVLISADVPKSLLVMGLPPRLAEALERYNSTCSAESRIRLRMALNAGEVHRDAHGVTGYAVNHTFRLIEAPELKTTLRVSAGPLAFIVSDGFFDDVVRHGAAAEPGRFQQVRVAVKETETTGWVCVPGSEATNLNGRAAHSAERPRTLTDARRCHYRLVGGPPHRYVGLITGDIRKVKDVDIWVNSENTDMKMSRPEERTISAIIRYEGAKRDGAGRIVEDTIADELAARVAGECPTAAGAAIATGPGELARSHNVRHVIHVAAVQGEPGAGYRQVQDVGRCVTGALAEADRLSADQCRATGALGEADRPDADHRPITSILFPLLGTGQGGGDLDETVQVLLGAAADHLSAGARISTVYFLARTGTELVALQGALAASPRFAAADIDPSASGWPPRGPVGDVPSRRART